MRTVTTILAATALALMTAGPALASCGAGQITQVGALSGDPEKDTFGLLCGTTDVEQTASITSMPRGEILPVGASTGDTEKDTLGYLQPASAQ